MSSLVFKESRVLCRLLKFAGLDSGPLPDKFDPTFFKRLKTIALNYDSTHVGSRGKVPFMTTTGCTCRLITSTPTHLHSSSKALCPSMFSAIHCKVIHRCDFIHVLDIMIGQHGF